MRLGEILWLHALWLAPALALLGLWTLRRKRSLLGRFVAAGLLPAIAPAFSPARQALKAAALIGALTLVVVALARPAWNATPQDVKRVGRDVVFVVDVSRSMLADDLKPSRLERAKIAIKDVLEVLRGDRVALIAFAGTATLKCPLTLDYSFLRQAMDTLSPDSVTRGGTNIGDTLREAVRVFDQSTEGYRDIVLITDGEDQESEPVRAAANAGEQGIRIIAIGLGDEGSGQRIPVTDDKGHKSFVTYDGKEVRSKLDAGTLLKVAAASKGGMYFNVGTGNINLDQVYAQLIRDAEKRQLEARSAVKYEEKFQIFLGAALALLTLEAFLGERRRS